MIKEALDWVRDLTRKASGCELLDVDSLPGTRYAYNHAGGRILLLSTGPGPATPKIESLASFVEAVRHVRETLDVVVYVTYGRVVAVIAPQTDGRSRITFDLEPTKAFDTLRIWNALDEDGNYTDDPMPQRELIDKLRVDFSGRVLPNTFLPALRKLKISKKEGGVADIAVGRETIGRELMAEITGDGQPLPDEVRITMPIYQRFAAEVTVTCSVNVYLTDMSFALRPLDGELIAAMDRASESVRTDLAASLPGVPVLHGVPSLTPLLPKDC